METIRNYQEKDLAAVRFICAGEEPETAERRPFWEALFDTFGRYYVEREPEHCFVAVDEQDQAIGYVLCAGDFSRWERDFTEQYLLPAQNPLTRQIGEGTIAGLRRFAPTYPAHLHIDLAPQAQRKGLGTALLNALFARLRAEGVPGVELCVAADNTGAQAFYRKCGFTVLDGDEQQLVMGIKL